LAAIRARRAQLRQVIDNATAEDRDLEVAERVIAHFEAVGSAQVSSSSASSTASIAVGEKVNGTIGGGKKPSQAYMVTTALRGAPGQAFDTPLELRDEIARLYRVEIKNSSFQPLLSRLAKEGAITRDGRRVVLPKEVVR
jgi:hypothetical protein